MHTYEITFRIESPICVTEEVIVDDYTIRPHPDFPTVQNGFLISSKIEAVEADKALAAFLMGIETVLDGMSILTQSMIFAPLVGSFLIFRETDNPDGKFLAQVATLQNARGLCFNKDMANDLKRLMQESVKSPALGYIREAISASGAPHKLSMLASAAEAFAGKRKVTSKCDKCGEAFLCKCGKAHSYEGTDNAARKAILGDDLEKAVFGGKGVRHKVHHGGSLRETAFTKPTDELYKKLAQEHIRTAFGITTQQTGHNVPRNWLFEYSYVLAKMNDGRKPELSYLDKHDLRAEDIILLNESAQGY